MEPIIIIKKKCKTSIVQVSVVWIMTIDHMLPTYILKLKKKKLIQNS